MVIKGFRQANTVLGWQGGEEVRGHLGASGLLTLKFERRLWFAPWIKKPLWVSVQTAYEGAPLIVSTEREPDFEALDKVKLLPNRKELKRLHDFMVVMDISNMSDEDKSRTWQGLEDIFSLNNHSICNIKES